MGMFDAPQSIFADDQVGGPLANLLGDYLRNVFTGQIAANGVLANNYYDPGRSFAQNALDPRAIQQAADIAAGVMGNGLGIKAYHGSPYDFDAFDASKIGTGEGAQAYGHGLYFAEAEPVARDYRNRLGGTDIRVNGQPHVSENLVDETAHRALYETGDIDKAIAQIQAMPRQGLIEQKAVEWLEGNRPNITVSQPGRMYEVNIKADPNAFLDWDKPLSQQPQAVQQALRPGYGEVSTRDLGPPPPGYPNRDLADLLVGGQSIGVFPKEKLAGQDLVSLAMQHDPRTGQAFYQGFADPTAASDALQQAGIPGIRYLDQGSRGAGEGTSNYVVFDPSIVEILRKYGILGPVVPGSLAPYAFGDNTQ